MYLSSNWSADLSRRTNHTVMHDSWKKFMGTLDIQKVYDMPLSSDEEEEIIPMANKSAKKSESSEELEVVETPAQVHVLDSSVLLLNKIDQLLLEDEEEQDNMVFDFDLDPKEKVDDFKLDEINDDLFLSELGNILMSNEDEQKQN